MILMPIMLIVIVVSYILMLGLVKFAQGVIDKGQPAKLRDTVPLETSTAAESL